MEKYTVEPVVCDYGLFLNGKLKLIINNRQNAELIANILEKDDMFGQGFNGNPTFTEEDFKRFLANKKVVDIVRI